MTGRTDPVHDAEAAAGRTDAPASLSWLDPPTGPAIALLDQTRLPHEEVTLVCRDVDAVIDAIRRLVVRGAPLLGVTGGYAVALAAALAASGSGADVRAETERIATARPTAVNLAWGARRVLAAAEAAAPAADRRARAFAALTAAHALAAEDAAASAAMAAHGLALVPAGARILTHCNTGRLVSAGSGTAFGVVAAAAAVGRVAHLWVDETRPLLQGARLTAYEAKRAGIPHTVLADSAAGSLFGRRLVDVVLVGADRISTQGDVANKVGTYPLAVLARHHGVPFVVVAPTATIDSQARTGADIRIEERAGDEVTTYAGHSVTPAGTSAYNPAFDVTPAELVSALVTESGVASPVDAASVARLVAAARR